MQILRSSINPWNLGLFSEPSPFILTYTLACAINKTLVVHNFIALFFGRIYHYNTTTCKNDRNSSDRADDRGRSVVLVPNAMTCFEDLFAKQCFRYAMIDYVILVVDYVMVHSTQFGDFGTCPSNKRALHSFHILLYA